MMVRRDPALRIWYNNKSNEYEEKGYIRKLSQTEAMTKSSKTYYIPHWHFSVIHVNKQPQKPRLVFDAAAKIRGESLNSNLLPGPDMNANLLGVFMRFR